MEGDAMEGVVESEPACEKPSLESVLLKQEDMHSLMEVFSFLFIKY